jgi:hypothetical protein
LVPPISSTHGRTIRRDGERIEALERPKAEERKVEAGKATGRRFAWGQAKTPPSYN